MTERKIIKQINEFNELSDSLFVWMCVRLNHKMPSKWFKESVCVFQKQLLESVIMCKWACVVVLKLY